MRTNILRVTALTAALAAATAGASFAAPNWNGHNDRGGAGADTRIGVQRDAGGRYNSDRRDGAGRYNSDRRDGATRYNSDRRDGDRAFQARLDGERFQRAMRYHDEFNTLAGRYFHGDNCR